MLYEKYALLHWRIRLIFFFISIQMEVTNTMIQIQ